MTDEMRICEECGHVFYRDQDRADEHEEFCDRCWDESCKDAEYEFWESYR